MVSRYIQFCTILAGVLLFLTILVFVFAAKKQSSRANALWEIVHDHCLADIQAHHNPAPCTEVDFIERAKIMLQTESTPLIDIVAACGFSSHAHFSSTFRQLAGVTPSIYRSSRGLV